MSQLQRAVNCTLHSGAVRPDGYGQVNINGKAYLAHRLAYVRSRKVGLASIHGLVVRHKCDNPLCIEPDHLEIGTQADNMRDMVNRDRQNSNEDHWNVILTDSQVESIRCRYIFRHPKHGGAALAKEYGVSKAQISRIVNNLNRRIA